MFELKYFVMELRKFSHFLLATLLIAIFSCDEDSNDKENNDPGSFTVSTSNIQGTSASISWSEPSDEDGDDLTYSVNLGSTEVASEQTQRSYTFSDLSFATEYSGSVVAMDGNGGESSATFSFTTDNEDGSPNENEDPGSFTVTVSDLTHNTAELSWTAAVDADGDDITYAITLDSEELESSQTGTTFSLTDLVSGEEFSGKVTASDGNDGTSEASFSFTSYVIDISLYKEMTGFVSATLVDCDYSEGGSGQCYEIVFTANNVDDDNTHLCPETTDDVGGLGNYDGDGVDNGSTQDGDEVGFSILNGALFEKMENDGYDIIDESGNIRIDDFTTSVNKSFDYCLEAAPDDELTLTFQIPVIPELLSTADDIESVEYLGLALDGTPMNGAPPSVVDFGDGNIPSLDRCGGHQDPAGYYHWHFIAQNMNDILDEYGYYEEGVFECEHITQSASALMGYARDGYPIYSSAESDGTLPDDLDDCNGHFGATPEYPDGIYHYHASTDVPNIPPCIVGKQSRDAFDKPQ